MHAGSDFLQADCLSLQALQTCLPPEGPAAVLTTDRQDEALLASLARVLGPKLLLPECWQLLFPQCGVLISSAISGGSFLQRLREAPEGRSWLLVEPLSMVFPLPCPTGAGTVCAAPPHGPGFFSPALQCQYAHSCQNHQGHVVLWDTEDTLAGKLSIARQTGFLGFADPGQAICATKNPTAG